MEALLLALDKAPELLRLTEAVADAQLVELAGSTRLAVAETQKARPAPVGAFGVLASLFDRDVQRALGVAIHLAQGFGRRMEDSAH